MDANDCQLTEANPCGAPSGTGPIGAAGGLGGPAGQKAQLPDSEPLPRTGLPDPPQERGLEALQPDR